MKFADTLLALFFLMVIGIIVGSDLGLQVLEEKMGTSEQEEQEQDKRKLYTVEKIEETEEEE